MLRGIKNSVFFFFVACCCLVTGCFRANSGDNTLADTKKIQMGMEKRMSLTFSERQAFLPLMIMDPIASSQCNPPAILRSVCFLRGTDWG